MNLRRILFYNLLGVTLVTTWWLPQFLVWSSVDDAIFWFFNQFITADHPTWTSILAGLNTRAFDKAMFVLLVVMLYAAMKRDPQGSWLKWGVIGFVMTATALVLQDIIHNLMTYKHASPTGMLDNVNLLTNLTSLPAKDTASSSFPSDHGLMAMIFAAFMWHFADRLIAWLATALVVLVCAPRIMVGAHWVSDVYVGALSIALIALPWVLCTPLASAAVNNLIQLFKRLSAALSHRHTHTRGDS
ncbi:phosphatase PAP2 family protein [Kushneria indalinina]|uniref:Lipid-A kinase n=1 Tax=Kushneria indalinina DSM 14324 TaxID=1122140 RepID=A0A3D9DS08_9GAMM|nr:phosphatase PAP2 family protein [Kushneria indalinina]REC93553.1 lipid-A kinase [Kushneria indalinina DSM 14324]